MPRIMMFKYVDRLRLPIRHQFLLFSTTKGAIQTKPVLTLLEEEKDFFDILKRVVRDNNLNSTIRVAGGWVRDRLMGRPSKYDIDLAVDNLTGVQFMKEMNDWMTHQGSSTYKFSIIALNPEKSKHLETVQLSYGKLKVDIVHLRTEEYSETSRVPVIALGTPMEDAYRRDLTINSLFYNINTEEIEDLTERGLVDLSEHVIRTPLPPLVTFTDDPLRALRAIRFACRFNFHIDKDLLDACSQENVRKLLGEKVSRERIRSEMDLILETHYSHRAFYLLYHTGLLQVIIPPLHQLHQKYDFHLIEFNFVPPKIDEELSSRIYAEGCFSVLLAHRLFQLLRSSSSSSSTYPEELRASLFGDVLQKVTPGFIHTNLLYLLLSLSSQGWKSQKKPFHSAPVLLLVDGIRLKNKEMAAMTQLLSALSVLNLIFDKLEGTAAVDSPRDTSISPAVKQLFDSDLQSRCYGPISRLELGSLMLQLDDGFFEASLILTVISRICFKLKQQQNWMKKDFDEGSLLLGRILNLSDEGRAVEEITLRLKKENNQHRLTEDLVESLLSEEMHTMLEVLKAAKDLDLQDVKDLKLFFSGTEIMEIFPHIQGKAVKEFKDLQQRWMLCHPQGSRTDVELFLREYVTRRSSS